MTATTSDVAPPFRYSSALRWCWTDTIDSSPSPAHHTSSSRSSSGTTSGTTNTNNAMSLVLDRIVVQCRAPTGNIICSFTCSTQLLVGEICVKASAAMDHQKIGAVVRDQWTLMGTAVLLGGRELDETATIEEAGIAHNDTVILAATRVQPPAASEAPQGAPHRAAAPAPKQQPRQQWQAQERQAQAQAKAAARHEAAAREYASITNLERT